MRVLQLAGVTLLALVAVPVAAQPSATEGTELVVRGDAVTRMEIERILNADNVDVSSLTARQVAEAIAAIPRGRAPRDFWTAYQAHVRAWADYAAAEERLGSLGMSVKPQISERAMRAAAEAEQATNSSFEEVERIAALYGVRMPTPPRVVMDTTTASPD